MVASVIILLLNRTLTPLKRPVYAGSQIFFIIQTPDRQYGVLTHIDDFKGFLTS